MALRGGLRGRGIAIAIAGRYVAYSPALVAAEVLATILGLFAFGSFRYQIHKNALSYGLFLVIAATFTGLATSSWHVEIAQAGWAAWAQHHLLTLDGLDGLVHADTLLFILGLTYFVSVIAQTRLLEGVTFRLLERNRGAILPTVIAVTAVVSVASGVFDGVSMIGLTVRALLIMLILAGAPTRDVRYAVMVCTIVTTVCGMWLAYGEPPNLIMRANLSPYLNDAFFLRYCAPAALVSYLVVWWRLRHTLGDRRVNLKALDLVDASAADVRFLQATRHGEVLTSVELVQEFAAELGSRADMVLGRVRTGESLGVALVRSEVPQDLRERMLGRFVAEDLAAALDRHYVWYVLGDPDRADDEARTVRRELARLASFRRNAQRIGALAVVPFVGLLVLHGVNHRVPLFAASFAGFLAALPALAAAPKMRGLALREARHEFAEYYFLIPLFLSITLLTVAGFFDDLQRLVRDGIGVLGYGHVAAAQFFGSAFLSAILDNNVVADFASRALHNLDIAVLHVFAMAQIAGYALGGCWTHIGSAQSVVAYAFIKREIDESFTPLGWIREITPLVLQIMAALTALIYLQSFLLG